MAGKQTDKKGSASYWGPVGFALALVLGVVVFAIVLGWPKPKKEAPLPQMSAEAKAAEMSQDPTQHFFGMLQDPQFKPNYQPLERECPIDKTKIKIPSRVVANGKHYGDNDFGGVATDLMKIALGPPPSGELIGEPSTTVQDFDSLIATCPKCKATYSLNDIHNIETGMPYVGASDKIIKWNLAEACPPLAAVDPSGWSFEERRLVRLLTQRQYGVEPMELGFTALEAAKSANFSVWSGRDYRIDSPAFYALGAAYFMQGLKDGSVKPGNRGLSLMLIGECYRLLGDTAGAQTYFQQALATGEIKGAEAEVLNEMDAFAKSGDTGLERAKVTGLQNPPIGWYLDKMLPAINGTLQSPEARDPWTPKALGADWGNPDAILTRIYAAIDKAHHPPVNNNPHMDFSDPMPQDANHAGMHGEGGANPHGESGGNPHGDSGGSPHGGGIVH